MPVDRLTGAFDNKGQSVLIADATPASWPGPPAPIWTLGGAAIERVTAGPSGVKNWTIYGWSITYVGALVATNTGGRPWAKFGDLWGGVLVDSPLDTTGFGGDQTKGVLPSDLSTLAKIYDGTNDPQFFMKDPPATTYPQRTRGLSVMLPQPVKVQAGATIKMALILLPSLMQVQTGGLPKIAIANATYELLYDNTSS